MFYFHSYLGKISNLTILYFSDGLVKNHQADTLWIYPWPRMYNHCWRILALERPWLVFLFVKSKLYDEDWEVDGRSSTYGTRLQPQGVYCYQILHQWYGWWLKSCTSLPHYLQGFIHLRWLAGFLKHQQYVDLPYGIWFYLCRLPRPPVTKARASRATVMRQRMFFAEWY